MDGRLEALEKEFVSRYLEFHPGYAVFAGLHDHDRKLEDLSRGSIGHCAELDRTRTRARVDNLSLADTASRGALLAALEGTLFDYRRARGRTIPIPTRSPSPSSSTRPHLDFAPVDGARRAVVAKERQSRSPRAPSAPSPTPPSSQHGIRGAEGASR
jgi:hypothetical protein